MIFSLHDTLLLNIAYSHYQNQTYKKYRHINRTLAIVKDPEQLFDKKAFWRRTITGTEIHTDMVKGRPRKIYFSSLPSPFLFSLASASAGHISAALH